MKTFGMILAAILLVGCIVALMSCKSVAEEKKQAPKGQLKSYEYTHSGTMAQPFRRYELKEISPDTVQLAIDGMSVDVADTIVVPREVLNEVGRIIIESKMYEYKPSYRPDFEVLDGEGWHFFAAYDDDTWLSSGGSNAWPSDAAGLFTITNYLDSCMVKYRK